MNKYEVRLLIQANGNRSYVHTVVFADNFFQANDLAMALAGPLGEIIFGPYLVDS